MKKRKGKTWFEAALTGFGYAAVFALGVICFGGLLASLFWLEAEYGPVVSIATSLFLLGTILTLVIKGD